MITQQELVDRRPVWAALSELFRDTELTTEELGRVRDELAGSPYSLPELDAILFREVLPVLGRNLTAPAGAWSGFDPDWLAEAIVRRSRRRFRWPSWALPRALVRGPWAQLREAVRLRRLAGSGAP